jgi:periplasmic protein CpxP/Spy
MKLNSNNLTYASLRFIAAATLVATLLSAPEVVFATDKDAHEDRTELRIKEMHAKLKITSAQKELWAKVAQTMLDDAKTMDALTQIRVDHAKDMTAVDDLKSFGEIADAYANGIKKMIPVFADLYASMSDAQKKEADAFFRYGYEKHSRKKKSVGK